MATGRNGRLIKTKMEKKCILVKKKSKNYDRHVEQTLLLLLEKSSV